MKLSLPFIVTGCRSLGWRLGSVLAIATLLVAGSAHGQEKARKKNIIVVVTDDQSVWSVGAYGNKESKTPHMDRLAREGIRFTKAFVATPVCSPSRASFATGRYGTQVKITDWIHPKEAAGGMGLPGDVTTWMQVLQRAGYTTGLIGKWHLGMTPEHHPHKRGYGTFTGFLGGGNSPMNPTLEIAGKNVALKGSLPDILVDHAIDFVKTNKAGPFAMQLHFRAPHTPYAPVPAEDVEPFKDLDPTIPKVDGLDVKQVKNLTRNYYASIHSVDRNLGRLLEALEKLGVLEDTIIIFTSDHGYMIGHHGLWHKGNATWLIGPNRGAQRANMYDLSLRVPLIVRMPRGQRGGTTRDEIVCNIDTFATVLGVLGVDPPADYKQEGKDFSPLLRGEELKNWRDAHFSQYDVHNNLPKGGKQSSMRSILTKEWHLVRQYKKNHPDELFDLVNDPDELKNLYNDPAHRAVRDRLQARLDDWMRSINDPALKSSGPTGP